jgi:NAD dependent epimerase/dehydratase family enzyme
MSIPTLVFQFSPNAISNFYLYEHVTIWIQSAAVGWHGHGAEAQVDGKSTPQQLTHGADTAHRQAADWQENPVTVSNRKG